MTNNEVDHRGPKRVGGGWRAAPLFNSDGSYTGENRPDAGERLFSYQVWDQLNREAPLGVQQRGLTPR